MKDEIKGDVIQITGIIVVAMGISYELATGAPLGFFLITAGSLAFAIGTKIKHRKRNENGRRKLP